MLIKKKSRLKKGLSMVEVVTSIGIMAIVGLIAVTVFTLSIRGERVAAEEFALQSSTRRLMDQTISTVRYATAIFILPESSFNASTVNTSLDFIPYASGGFLSADWNYHGIVDDTIVRLRWSASPAGHRVERLFEGANEGFNYDLSFSQIDATNMDDTMVQISLQVDQGAGAVPELGILTAADSLNAMQVVDFSTNINPGRAIAYRMDELERDTPIARVVLVLDVSGSMGWVLPGGMGGVNMTRIAALQESSLMLLETFSKIEDLYVTIIPYSQLANFGRQVHNVNYNNPATNANPRNDALVSLFGGHIQGNSPVGDYRFVSAMQYHSQLEDVINSLRAQGGTNSGDGMRRGYWTLVQEGPPPAGRTVREYFIFMTDGDANTISFNTSPGGFLPFAIDRLDPDFFLGPGDVPVNGFSTARLSGIGNDLSGDIHRGRAVGSHGDGNDLRSVTLYETYSIPFMTYFAQRVLARPANVDYVASMNTYIVALSEGASEHKINDISYMFGHGAIANDAPNVFRANRVDELTDAFQAIANSIVLDLWHASGPNIVPPVVVEP